MASKHKQEDPWAGFVDVLSNILMVVIFLVVILGMAIFALSQQITKVAVEKAVKAEQERHGEQARKDPAVAEESSSPKADTTRSEVATAPETEKGAAGAFEAARALRARENDETTGNTNLSVRSVRTVSKEIEVASEEQKPSTGEVIVQAAHAFLTLKFGKGSFRIDGNATGAIQSFLGDQGELKEQKVEIRAFAQSTVGSISEARRIAYYRAMQIRTELLKNGFSATRMEIKIRESILPEEIDVVRIFRKT